MGERDVGDEAPPKKGADPAPRAVEELVGHEDVERLVLLLQAPDGAGREDSLDPERLEPVDVGAKVQLRREDSVAGAVARQERHSPPPQRPHDVGTRRIAERS